MWFYIYQTTFTITEAARLLKVENLLLYDILRIARDKIFQVIDGNI